MNAPTDTSSAPVSPLHPAIDAAHWLLRVALASVFLYHGVGKLVDVSGFGQMAGLPNGVAWLVTAAEVGGALAILVGAFIGGWLTRLGAAAIVPVMLGAIFMVHWGRWSFTPSDSHPAGGMEFQVVLLLIALFFLIRGNSA